MTTTAGPAVGVQLHEQPGQWVIQARTYRLRVLVEEPLAVLSAPDGTVWSELSLVAGVDRIDAPDLTYRWRPPEVAQRPDGTVTVLTRSASPVWRRRSLVLTCAPDELAAHVEVRGPGRIADVTLLGGKAVLGSGAAGDFRSGIRFASLFVPTPTEPVQAVRSSSSAARLGVVGDADPGRLNAVFSPPPLCFGFGHDDQLSPTELADGRWLGCSVVGPVTELGFTGVGYEPLDGGFLLRLDYQGHTPVAQAGWTSPAIVLRPATSPVAALTAYRQDLAVRGWAGPPPGPAPWHHEPIFCGWGAQCAQHAAAVRRGGDGTDGDVDDLTHTPGAGGAARLCRQEHYDRWLDRLARHGIQPGTVTVDDQWQLAYGTNEPDPEKWPDLRAWIADQHDRGRRVLLWWKAWDPAGLDPELCLRDPDGTPVAVDVGNPAYRAEVVRQVGYLLGPDGLDADGFKVDFTQRGPSGSWLSGAPDSATGAGLWGIAALHRLVATLHDAAKQTKPDALVVTQCVHPSFGSVSDMVRLNDVLKLDPSGVFVPVVDQLRFRQRIARTVLPAHLIDTDQWPMPDRAGWLAYAAAQTRLGVPALYYVDTIDVSGETITDDDLELVAAQWRAYRAGLS